MLDWVMRTGRANTQAQGWGGSPRNRHPLPFLQSFPTVVSSHYTLTPRLCLFTVWRWPRQCSSSASPWLSSSSFSFSAMIATLKGTLRVLSETVLPAGTPAVEPIPAAMDATAPIASRKRLEGSIVKCSGDKYLLIPPGSSRLSASSRKIPMSASGDEGDVADRTEAALATLNPENVMIGILT